MIEEDFELNTYPIMVGLQCKHAFSKEKKELLDTKNLVRQFNISQTFNEEMYRFLSWIRFIEFDEDID